MMYDEYKHLLGRRYLAGQDDCYGLAMNYYRDVYGFQLTDFARPDGWWNEPDFDLISDMIHVDKWGLKSLNPRSLKTGDGLVFSLLQAGRANHVGVYVGNGLFIHHVFGRISVEEALLPKWTSRLLMVLEHEEVIQMRDQMRPKTDFLSLLPENVKRQVAGAA